MTSQPATFRRNLLAGVLAGLGGALVFATVHAILIVPIWTRAAGGFAFGAVAGGAIGLAYTELAFEARAHAGVRFGALLWLVVAPVTLVDATLRALQAPRSETIAVVVAVALSLAGGALLGWARARSWRAVLAGGAAALALMLVMGGPVAVGRGPRGVGIFFGVLLAAAVGGALLGSLSCWLGRIELFPAARPGPVTS